MRSLLPLEKVIEIADAEDNAIAYGLELTLDDERTEQHWFLTWGAPPDVEGKEVRSVLPERTTWRPTESSVWSGKTAADEFMDLVRKNFREGETMYAYCIVSKDPTEPQPDVGGFVMRQDERYVGFGKVYYDAERGFQETWILFERYAVESAFQFIEDSSGQVHDEPGSTKLHVDVRYFQDLQNLSPPSARRRGQ